MNPEIAIRVSHLSKRYEIGKNKSDSLRQTLGSLVQIKKKQFDFYWALNDLNFEIKKGDVVGIIGKNGAGKSTLLKILSQITKPTTGRIEINGRIASLLEVGTGFHPELTGRENIYLNGTILGMTRKEVATKFDEIVEFSGVEKFIDTPVKRYSSGMYVRLAFAVAAHLEPEILVVDEVLAVGDAEFQKKCLGKMQDVAGQGRTVLFVSHNMSAVRSLCNKAILLDKGTVKYLGDVESAFQQYNSNDVEPSTEFDFQDHEKRMRGQKQLTVANVILDKQYYSPQEAMKVEVTVQNNESFNGKVDIIFFFMDNLQNIIYQCDSRAMNLSFNYDELRSFKLELDRLDLSAGIYNLGVWIGGNGIEQDYVDSIQFEVVSGSIYPNTTSPIVSIVQRTFTISN